MNIELAGQCIADTPGNFAKLARLPRKVFRVVGEGVNELRQFAEVRIDGVPMWAGVKTGTLYDTRTMVCLSSHSLRLTDAE